MDWESAYPGNKKQGDEKVPDIDHLGYDIQIVWKVEIATPAMRAPVSMDKSKMQRPRNQETPGKGWNQNDFGYLSGLT